MSDITTFKPYKVLARAYRPENFDGLIGQDTLVRTLTNAIAQNRIAQAFMLTGVRGVGKTTTARIIAKALNCIGEDGKGQATISPCGQCQPCKDIANDRHVDVLEIDAASHTGVDQVRELTDSVYYKPAQARYKIFILDEVHMLSSQAFNAILKTLEEPPPHVKFIFATTEIRKVPVTVLSRCQRFDLRRVPLDLLTTHYETIATKEGLSFDEEAIKMIAKAADGSVRDGLSLLDQAIALSGNHIETVIVRDMLGLADRSQVWDLFEAILNAAPDEAIKLAHNLYNYGADPAVITQDIMEMINFLSRAKLNHELLNAAYIADIERSHGLKLLPQLTLANLARLWKLSFDGLMEIRQAPQPMQAFDMLIMRMIYTHPMPSINKVMEKLNAMADAGVIVTNSQIDTKPQNEEAEKKTLIDGQDEGGKITKPIIHKPIIEHADNDAPDDVEGGDGYENMPASEAGYDHKAKQDDTFKSHSINYDKDLKIYKELDIYQKFSKHIPNRLVQVEISEQAQEEHDDEVINEISDEES